MTAPFSDALPHDFDGAWIDASFVGEIDPRDLAGAWLDAEIPIRRATDA